MKQNMARPPSQDDSSSSSSSSSKRHFHWTEKVGTQDDEDEAPPPTPSQQDNNSKSTLPTPSKKKLPAVAVARIRTILTAFAKNPSTLQLGRLGPRVVGTLFGHRRGHVHFAFQKDPNSPPAFLVELATPITCLVREMASGLVRIALECDKEKEEEEKEKKRKSAKLLEELMWRTYCNGKKCGFATRKECGAKEWKVLKAVEPISMGAGVLPGGSGDDGELMYMRAKFERIVGSRDSEAFYMMNPDSNGTPELSIYLLRI